MTPDFYHPSIILHQSNDNLNIIDGQQRIITLAIIENIKRKPSVISGDSSLTGNRIKDNYKLLLQLLFKDDGEAKEIIDLSKINCTLIVTDNEDDAYTFFETQNSGGVRLGGPDILKAFHLRAISQEHKRSEYAILWEDQHQVGLIMNYLLKARRWNALDFKEVPRHTQENEIKQQLIDEFSVKKNDDASEDIAYRMVAFKKEDQGDVNIKIPGHLYDARQPLNNGENFISYLCSFSQIYHTLFSIKSDSIPEEFYRLNDKIIQYIDGTAYLKEFFEISMILYVSKFGTDKILEAAFWIFRYTYSLRLSKAKTVREISIPVFLRDTGHLFDIILTSYNHDQLIISLKQFPCEINQDNLYEENKKNLNSGTVKGRFAIRIKEYFEEECKKKGMKRGYKSILEEIKDQYKGL